MAKQYVVYLCTGTCVADCRHGEPCVHGALGVRYEHPVTKTGKPAHLAFDDENMVHRWTGQSTQCTISANHEEIQ